MVVTGLNNGCFCADMGDVVLSEVTSDVIIEFSLYYGSFNLQNWSERYTPDIGYRIKVRNLGKIVIDFFTLTDLTTVIASDDSSFNNNLSITGVIKDELGERITTFYQEFYFSFFKVASLFKEYNRFLNRYTQRKIRIDQFLPLYYRNDLSLKVGVAYYSNGNALYPILNFADSTLNRDYQYRNLSPARIIKQLNEQQGVSVHLDDLIFYEAYLYQGGVLVDKIRFDIDRNYYKQLTHFVFYNLFGIPETIYMTGRNETKGEFSGTYGVMGDEYHKVDTELYESYTVNSGYITSVDYESIKDLIRSKSIFRYEGEKLERITITDIEMTHEKPKSTPLNIQLTYRLADDNSIAFSRPELVESRIFDKSFDYTFN